VTESKIFPLIRANDESGQNSSDPTVALFASNDGTVARAKFGYLLKDSASFDGVVSAPVRGEVTEFASQKGLNAGVRVKGSLRLVPYKKSYQVPLRVGWLRSEARETVDIVSAENNAAILSARGLVDVASFSFDQLVRAAMNVAVGIQAAGGRTAAISAARSRPLQALLANPVARKSIPVDADVLAQRLDSSQGRAAFASAFRFLANDLELWQVERAVVLSMSGSTGRPTFTIAESAGFRDVTKVSKGFELALGIVQTRTKDKVTSGYYVGGSFSTGRAFSGDPENICLPLGGITGGTRCQDALTVEPSGQTFEVYQGDVRWYFNELEFAVAARPSYDRKGGDERWAVEFPIYFLQNSKDLSSPLDKEKAGLTGGVTFGWRQRANGAGFFAVFSVGALFRVPGVP
jgi:hypothetical protein